MKRILKGVRLTVLLQLRLNANMSLSHHLECTDRFVCVEAMIMLLHGLLRSGFPAEC